ncbi:hypothetical protein [Oceanobacillus indicireducens]|uniref:Uncharacterized protein n=1 Tax=Oceanobacillus indicireducens TaxID=1004261 RepID=A0A918D4F9_9BACI|nr:hypothetical protein [Oceanobacillus indicireducens]GGN66325.1 hypothetical protein GCM10007971_36160 [Oceanobacillus indicireducens]
MTFGEMKQLTDHFNQIKGASQKLKNKRLKQLIKDIEGNFVTYGPNQNIFAAGLVCAAFEELEVR